MYKWRTRLISVLLAAVLLCTLCVTAFAEDDVQTTISIRTADDLLALAQSCTLDTWSQDKVVELEGDLSLEGVAFTPIASFGGTFHGNGYTISGLSLGEGLSYAGLFQHVQSGGSIEDLNVTGTVQAASSCAAAGGIAAVNAGRIMNSSFSGNVSASSCAGAIAGINEAGGMIVSSSSNGAVTGTQMTGGIAGSNAGQILSCTNAAYVNTVSGDKAMSLDDLNFNFSLDMTSLTTTGDTILSSYDTGGVAGYSSGTIRGCRNTAVVGYQHVGYNVGGIAGRSCGYILNCKNAGAVYGRKDVGGIVGQMEPYIEMQLTESTLSKLQTQLQELGTLVDKASSDAEGGANSISSSLGGMSGYISNAANAANELKLNIDANGSLLGHGTGSGSGNLNVTKPSISVDGGGVDISIGDSSVSIGGGLPSISIGDDPLDIDLSKDGVVDGILNGSAQIVAAPDLGSLSSSIGGISSQINRLNGALSGTAGKLSDDMREINAKFNEITDTLNDAVADASSGAKDVVTDASAIDVDLVTLGKVNRSENSAYVDGDINVGGIAGSMAIEYSYDPEDDVSGDMSAEYKRQYEMKAIVQNCTNDGTVHAKRSYAGGICGRMDLGLITDSYGFGRVESESGDYVGGIAGQTGATVRQSYAKCALSGGKYVGGIVGAGVQKTLTGASSTISGCYSMVEIDASTLNAGAIAGSDAGDFAENYFVSDTLAGLDTVSFSGKAEPMSYEELLQVPGLPKQMRKLTLQFVADDTVLKSESFDYGDSFEKDVYPDIPEKDGYYGRWDITELDALHFDTTVTAVYTQYVTTVANESRRESGRPVFFVEGNYDEDAEIDAKALALSNTGLAPVSSGLSDAISHYMSVNPWYTWFSAPINKEIVEQWSVTLPSDGEQVHTVHYLSPNESVRRLAVYVRQDGGWKKVETESFGTYLTFRVSGTQAEIAVVSVLHIWWVWAIVTVLLLGLILLIVLLILKAARRRRAKNAPAAPLEDEVQTEADGSLPQQKKRKKFPVWLTVILMLAALAAAAAAVYFFVIRGRFAPYQALSDLNQRSEVTMDLSVDVKVGQTDLEADGSISRKRADGTKVTKLSLENLSLYYADERVILESGTAYRLTDQFPDYTSVLTKLIPLYQQVEYTTQTDGDEKIYRLSAQGSGAQELLAVILPDTIGKVSDTQQISAEVCMTGSSVESITVSAAGTLTDAPQTAFDVALEFDDISLTADFTVPDAVTESIKSGSGEDLPVLTDELYRLLSGWAELKNRDALSANLELSADCGPVVVKNDLKYYRQQTGGMQVSCINKNGLNIFFTDGEDVFSQSGDKATGDAKSLAGTAELFDVLELVCREGDIELSQDGETYRYTLSLDSRATEQIVSIIAPGASDLDIDFTDSRAEVVMDGGVITRLQVSCSGSMKLLLTQASAEVSANMTFTEAPVPEIPEDVLNNLK